MSKSTTASVTSVTSATQSKRRHPSGRELKKLRPVAMDRSGASSTKSRAERSLWLRPGYVFAQLIGFAVVAVMDFLLAFFIATRLLPIIMASVATGLGIVPDSTQLAGFMVWLMSSLVLALFLVALGLIAMRGLWRLRRRALARLGTRITQP